MPKIRIPVVVTKSGTIVSGTGWLTKSGDSGSNHDHCYESLTDDEYQSGCAVVHVEADIDIDAVFKEHEVKGTTHTS